MKLHYILKIILGVVASVCSFTAAAQMREAAFAMNERLGRGVNIGNSFEAPSETAWGNPWKPEYFRRIAELGFQHVRVPVRWEPAERSLATEPYTIAPEFLGRIKEVIDTALQYKLHIVINMHHHEALFADPGGEKARFLSQWYQIADYFKDYPDSLLFEVLNEPHGNLTAAMWNDYFAEALTEIRKTNPTRIVLMGIADYGGLGGIANLLLPDDEYIILTPHYYNPFPFTHQGAEWVNGADAWLGTKWHNTEAERETVASEFSYALNYSATHHIPIHVGEFGAYSKADAASRVLWTTFLARWFEENNMSWAYWDFSAGFGIYNPATGLYVEELVDALLHNSKPEPTPVFETAMYVSNFSGGTDGWSLMQQGGAAGTLSATNNALNVSISNPGTEGWHLQLVKNNVTLRQGKLYRLSFNARATADRSLTFYAGRASTPWDSYSGFNGASIGTAVQTYSVTFTMNSPTDPAARLVFDLGTKAPGVIISAVRLDELSFSVTGIEDPTATSEVGVYPNPFLSAFTVTSAAAGSATLFDVTGRMIRTTAISAGETSVECPDLAPGLYYLRMGGDQPAKSVKIIKR